MSMFINRKGSSGGFVQGGGWGQDVDGKEESKKFIIL